MSTGERTAFVAEELGFEQLLGKSGGVDGNERSQGAARAAMNEPRHHFLARSGFTGNQAEEARRAAQAQERANLLQERVDALVATGARLPTPTLALPIRLRSSGVTAARAAVSSLG